MIRLKTDPATGWSGQLTFSTAYSYGRRISSNWSFWFYAWFYRHLVDNFSISRRRGTIVANWIGLAPPTFHLVRRMACWCGEARSPRHNARQRYLRCATALSFRRRRTMHHNQADERAVLPFCRFAVSPSRPSTAAGIRLDSRPALFNSIGKLNVRRFSPTNKSETIIKSDLFIARDVRTPHSTSV